MKSNQSQSNYQLSMSTPSGERGFGLVSTMLALSLLAVFALVAAALAVNERRSAYNDEVHTSAFLSADSGGEAAINWLRSRERVPISDMATRRVASPGETVLHNSQRYQYSIRFNRKAPSGQVSDTDLYYDAVYDVDSQGAAGVEGQSSVGMVVTKLTKKGY